MNPIDIEYSNSKGEKARELFTIKHKYLMIKGGKWMKDAANSYTVVGSLIITIMFAVAFIVPGDSTQDTGLPIFFTWKFI